MSALHSSRSATPAGWPTPSRAEVLLDYAILDTPSEAAFDDIATIASQVCAAPIATVSLLDTGRQWFKARIGLEPSETPIEQAVCRLDIDRPELLVIPDLTADPRTSANPLVRGEPHIRFYAGAPLVLDDGIAIGRLCVMDRVPRPEGLDAREAATLTALARQVTSQLELGRSLRRAAQMVRLQACLVDVGERIRRSGSVAEMTSATAELVGIAMEADRAAFGRVDAATESVVIEPDWTAPGMRSIAGSHRFADFGQIRDELAAGEPLIIHDVTTDPRTAFDPAPMRALDIGALVNIPVRDRDAITAVLIVQYRTAHLWSEIELAFLRSVADRIEAGVTQFVAEQQQQTLNDEISHRLKNTLAMVQAIAARTLRHVPEREPVRKFEDRLLALARAHDVLTQNRWSGAGIAAVLADALAGLDQAERVDRSGPDVALGPKAALTLAMLVHELTTNAVKYGALLAEGGRVSVHWSVAQEGGREVLTLHWRERGGPPVTPPAAAGFGSRLIQLGLVGTGDVALRYPTTGFEADMRASLAHLAAD